MSRKRGRPAHIPPFRRLGLIIKTHVREVARDEIDKFAWELRGELVNGILQQKFESFKRYPLTEEWIKRKRKRGLDPRVLIATRQYVDHITVIRRSAFSHELNVPKNAKAKGENRSEKELTLRQLGAIHEYGSAAMGIPPRSHWRVILERGKNRAPSVAKKIAKKAGKKIRRDLSRGTKRRGNK